MADVAVDVSGEMSPPSAPLQQSFLKIPTELPDPKEWISKQRQNVRSWILFTQTSNFKVPPSLPRLGKRIMRNIEYFQANYLFVFLGLVVYCLVTSPLFLIAIAGTFYVGYRLNKRQQEKKLVICGKELTLAQQYVLITVCSWPVYYLVGGYGVMFWLMGASLIIITLHAAFYNIEAIIAKDEDSYTLLEQV
ncbi:unnamed protein product [Phyllotreta striolata]|uniref:PRA1 family protein n=1 Tax=Phyllotreta striolata TaxID=444603 RepID=A0A9N9XQJ5_PHYSR|nr:unnamed protein product [Phyllotreta striolata]